ncbi:unnamed protein product, partial [Penicillium egyptiacum]
KYRCTEPRPWCSRPHVPLHRTKALVQPLHQYRCTGTAALVKA